MKRINILLFLVTTFVFAQESFTPIDIPNCQILLKDGTGIQDVNAAVFQWDNQAQDNFHAVQSDPDLRPVPSFETWPGYVTLANEGAREYLYIEDIDAIDFSNGMTVFYVGKTKDLTALSAFVGNHVGNTDIGYTGWRLGVSKIFQVKADFGLGAEKQSLNGGTHNTDNPIALSLQYSDKQVEMHQGSLDQVFSRTLSEDLVLSDRPLLLNAQYKPTNLSWIPVVANYEMASVIIFNRDLDANEHDQVWAWLKEEYPDAFDKGFGLEEGFKGSNNLSEDASLEISFNQELNSATEFPIVYKNSLGENPIAGTWELMSDASKIKFTPLAPFEKGSLVVVDLLNAVTAAGGDLFENTKERYVSYIVETEEVFDIESFVIPSIKVTEQSPGISHNIPLEISIPKSLGSENSLAPTPVVFWVHGGAWSGGTLEESFPAKGNFSSYLVKHAGVAVIGVAYRCKGSLGNFTEAMEDIESAVQWAKDNAEAYNLDVTRIGFAGGSAGGPLSALAAQRTEDCKLYVGFNGIYDFVDTGNSAFGGGNAYEKTEPSAAANSAMHNIKDVPPYTLLLHGSEDTTIDPNQSVRFAEAVIDKGGSADVNIYDGEVHSFFSSGQMNIPCTWEFKEACLKAFDQNLNTNLIIKSIHNKSSYAPSFNNESYYFTFVELKVLYNSINLNDYFIRFLNGVDDATTTRKIGGLFTKTIDSYDSETTTYTTSVSENTNLAIGSSFYFIEMYKEVSNGDDLLLTTNNNTMYRVFQEYLGLSDAEMLSKKYFTVATATKENFEASISDVNSFLTIRKGSIAEDVWTDGLAEDTAIVRSTLIPTTTFTPSQWTVPLSTNNIQNTFENTVFPNPVAAGEMLNFNAVSKGEVDNTNRNEFSNSVVAGQVLNLNADSKEIRIYDLSGQLMQVDINILNTYVIPESLHKGVYILKIKYSRGAIESHQIIVI